MDDIRLMNAIARVGHETAQPPEPTRKTVELSEQTQGLVQAHAGRGVAAPPVAIPPQRRKETHPLRQGRRAGGSVQAPPRLRETFSEGQKNQEFMYDRAT